MQFDFDKIRIWQTHFSVLRAFDNLPIPEVIVYEQQSSPEYYLDGKYRFEEGSQLVITLKGEGRLKIKDSETVLAAGKTFLHNHNDHDVCYFYPPHGKEKWEFLWFSFYGGNSSQLVNELNNKYGYIFDITPDSELVNMLKEYKKYAGEVQILSPVEGAKFVYDILSLLCKIPDEKNRPTSNSSLIGEIQSLINYDPSAELHVDRIAERFNLSREHLSRIFCQETGTALHEYIIRIRLKMAINLLLQTRLSSKEIADRCGWNDYSNFYRIFKQRCKCSPLQFRAKGIRPQI